jgi:hypothetical protein
MSHRVFNLEYGLVNAFDTGLAAHRFIAKTKGAVKVLCRKRFFYMRDAEGASIHVILHATRHPENEHILDAANKIAVHIENEIEQAASLNG